MIDDQELEQRLRRTFDTIAATPLAAPSFPRRVPLARWAAAAAAVVLLAGGVAVALRPEEAPTVSTSVGPPALPVPNTPEEVTLFRAEERLVHDCMTTSGWPFQERRLEPGRLDPHWDALGRTDADRAATVGYGVADRPPEHTSWLEHVHPPNRQAWLAGVATCTEEARTTLYGDAGRYAELEIVAATVEQEVRHAVTRDRRYRAALDDWVECMGERGHGYADPTEAVEAHGLALDEPSAAELETARDDVTCKAAADLVETYARLDAELRPGIEAGNGELRTYRVERATALELAQEAISVPAIYFRAPREAGGPPPANFTGAEVPLEAPITLHALDGKHWIQIDLTAIPDIPGAWFQVVRDGDARHARLLSDITDSPTFAARMDPVIEGMQVQVVLTDAEGTVLAAGPVVTLDFEGVTRSGSAP